MMGLQTTENVVQTTDYRLQTIDSRLQTKDYRWQNKPQTTVHRLQSTDYRPQTSDYRLHSVTGRQAAQKQHERYFIAANLTVIRDLAPGRRAGLPLKGPWLLRAAGQHLTPIPACLIAAFTPGWSLGISIDSSPSIHLFHLLGCHLYFKEHI